MNKPKNHDLKLIGIDVLRFVLSLSILIWHYQHFYQPFKVKAEIFTSRQPFYRFLVPFYLQGDRAVQLFWIISGIIFFRVYYRGITDQSVSFKKFMINRFSRLYPLHLVTLIIVALLQAYYFSIYKTNFVYSDNDTAHFILNIFFVQNWLTYNSSFNGPSWSVSVEILIYICYFILCSTKALKSVTLNIVVIILFFTLDNLNWGIEPVNQCFYFFFSGCLFSRVLFSKDFNIKKMMIYTLLYLGLFFAGKHLVQSIYHVDANQILPVFVYNVNMLLLYMVAIYFIIILFNHQIFNRVNLKLFTTLGNLTYSMYLVHFSVQLGMFLVLKPKNYALFNSPAVFLSFVSITVVLGYLVFHYFERPVQNKLRQIMK